MRHYNRMCSVMPSFIWTPKAAHLYVCTFVCMVCLYLYLYVDLYVFTTGIARLCNPLQSILHICVYSFVLTTGIARLCNPLQS